MQVVNLFPMIHVSSIAHSTCFWYSGQTNVDMSQVVTQGRPGRNIQKNNFHGAV
jgi:hypothetical protein